MKNKKILAITALCLILILIFGTIFVLRGTNEAEYSLIPKFKVYEPEYVDNVVDSNIEFNGYSLSFQENPMKITITDNNGNAFLDSQNGLLLIGYTDFKGKTDTIDISSTDYTLKKRSLRNGVSLGFYFKEYGIGLTLELWFNEYGLMARVPVKSIVEKSNFGLTVINLLPNLGATGNVQDGFIVYPDGSGSLYTFNDEKKQISPIVKEMYFGNSIDLDSVDESIKQGDYNIMIPTYGITNGQNGVVGYVTSGDSNAYLTLTPSGFENELNKAYVSCLYRKSYSYTSPNGVVISEIERSISAEDFSVQYLFMESNDNPITYSDMAVVVREFMMAEGLIEKKDISSVKANIQLIMGAKQNTGMSSSLTSVTSFDEAKEIVGNFTEDEQSNLRLYLLGWQKGGYGFNPSGDKAAEGLGGTKGLEALNRWLTERKVESYLAVNYIEAINNGIGFNKSSQAVYSEANVPISNSDFTKYLRNPLLELSNYLKSRISYFKKTSAFGVAFEKSGYYLYDDYESKRRLSRGQMADVMSEFCNVTAKNSMKTAVQGGNSYLLGFADCIYDLPETNSGNSAMTQSIPYYQMIVHGLVPYCGTVSGNMSPEYQVQKLKWIETGSQPYFILTYGSSDLLKNTYVTDAYDTDYLVWESRIKQCIKEFNTNLKFTANSTISSHEYINDDLVKVTYSNGATIYINYSNSVQIVDGVTVNSKDYTIKEANAK